MRLSDTDLLLGCDFYDDNEIVIDFAKKVLVWGNTEIQINLEKTQIQVIRVQCTADTMIPARSRKILEGRLATRRGK